MDIFEYAEQGNQFRICFSIPFTVFDPVRAESYGIFFLMKREFGFSHSFFHKK
ncbi:hypothetical protein LEP1GSC161_0987 [Leptospira santarosai str. CBC1416]|uniref:Uncharacterized protein n=1 Tax=Leptospira santarosai str. CBC1416 TaxID=1193059 RepID=M6VTJ6_9LEPT|nr:hypothetical protein LEP1GSC165_3855 [Leptospira santarosai str. CBC523]EMO56364.1 hypothetical protein LEP1GSC161_0987 [Leptospira santarosai str. CBC1416]